MRYLLANKSLEKSDFSNDLFARKNLMFVDMNVLLLHLTKFYQVVSEKNSISFEKEFVNALVTV